jgi:hypothetical protein
MSIRRALLALIIGGAAAVVLVQSNAEAAAPSSAMSARAAVLLKKAVSEGASTVTLLIASKPGQNRAVASDVARLGGSVRFRDDDVGYLRVIVPTDKARAVAALPGVQSVDLDEHVPLPDPRPEGIVTPTPQTPPGAATPNDNPYMPIGDTGAAQFRAAHPTWDGRGVTVGILDSGITLDHPSLQTTSTGERKIVDWLTYTDPFDDDDPTWISMAAQVSGASFTFGGQTYTAPYKGTFRIGLFNERDPRLGGEVGNDVNRDGNPAGSSGIFAVLWDMATNYVYVDTNQNRNFADDMAMTDYRVHYHVNYFGTDNPATAVVERMPFVVQTDGKNKFVNIGIVSAQHGSHVAGIVGANALFGGAMSGAAPGAKIVSVRVCLFIAGCTAHALVEGMIRAAKQSNVDVINMSIGGLPALNDANNTRAVLYDRLIEQYKVQMFISAGNSGSGMNTIGDPSVAGKVMSVGSYITDATWAANYGSTAPAAGVDNLHPFSSRGPREDGGFKPNIVAPGAAISTTPLWQPGGPVPGTYALPPGYSMLNGTSMASPQAAGAAALLVSAAKQAGVQHKPEQLRQALNSSARFIASYGAYEQGNGLIQVSQAWDLLATNIKPVGISSAVAVNTALAPFLATPNVGVGIHDREGVVLGQSYTRRYTFTRTSGGGGTRTYNLSWVGNDGTFSSAASIGLPLNQPRTLDVSINPATIGAHSAILNLDDPTTGGIDYQTLNTVVVARQFSAANAYTNTITDTVARNAALDHYFAVPSGAPALKVDFSGPSATPGTGQARFVRNHPWGLPIDSNSSLQCYSPPVPGGGCSTGSPLSRSFVDPTAGVWEMDVEARRTSDVDLTPFSMTVSLLGASVAPDPDVLASAMLGIPVARSYVITNLFAPFTGRAVGTTLGSARLATPTIAHLQVQQFPVVVTAGSTSLRATIGSPSDGAADLDLFVFNCTTGTCVLAGQSADGDSEESVTIANPAAGTWVVLVDGFAVPAGTTQYDYVDVFVNPAFGSVVVTDANALRPSGASWIVPGTVTANAAPATGRVLLGAVQVRTDTNVLVGSGDVIVESVTP